jgi:hypothetical protein
VEFDDVYGPPHDNGLSQTPSGTCVACCTLEAPAETKAALRIGWDKRIVVQVNDGPPSRLADHTYFQPATIDVQLRRGRNFVAIGLSTLPKDKSCFLSRGGSCFSFSCTTADGTVFKPMAVDKRTH